MPRDSGRSEFATLVSIAIVIALLYFAREFLIPVSLAALLGFLLNPLLRRLEDLGVPRAIGVIGISLALLSAAAAAAWFISTEVSGLIAGLPDFKATFAEKLRALRGPLRSLADGLGWIDQLGKELDPAAGRSQAPKVEIVEPGGLPLLGRWLTPLLGPLGTAGIVAVLAIFMLSQSDLPKRIVSWLALGDSRLSPRAVDEAGALVSGFLGRQALVCLLQGVAVGVGLGLIGVPGALVFAFISALLRSIPYFGPTTAAALPIAFSAAAFHGFEMTLWTAGFFVCWELFSNNVLDPHVLGRGAGLTPFGVILSATFWAWLWGAPGLFLAIPLTACLTVVGRYVPQLAFLPALLSHDPIAPPSTQLYERLMNHDAQESAALLRHAAAEGDLVRFSDSLVLPMLVKLSSEREAGRVTRLEVVQALRRLRALLAELLATVPIETVTPAARALRVEELRSSALDRFARDWIATVLERCGFQVLEAGRARGEAATLVLASVSERAPIEAASSARISSRVRGRDALLLAAASDVRGLTLEPSVPILPSCAALVAALTPAPIARAQPAAEAVEPGEPKRHTH
ncbi:MAG TPA: AI-2E family transporter [Myxococcota bacterium]|nr:AI-2E family transporter [Myxococcota bacterium]